MKKLLTALLALVLFLTGCSLRFTLPEETEATFPPYVPTTAPTQTIPPPAVGETIWISNVSPSGDLTVAGSVEGAEYPIFVYSGGELHIPLTYECWRSFHMELLGVGILVFLDGQPQPYRVEENGDYQYMHRFGSDQMGIESGNYQVSTDLIFTPVTGKAGDDLELYIVVMLGPDFLEDQQMGDYTLERSPGSVLLGCTQALAVARFEADAERQPAFPTVSERLREVVTCPAESWAAEEREIVRRTQENTPYFGDTRTVYPLDQYAQQQWSYHQVGATIKYNPADYLFNVKQTSLIPFRYCYGTEKDLDVEVTVFFDHVPASNSLRFQLSGPTEGRIEVDFKLSMEGFDGYAPVYVVCVPRNLRQVLAQSGEVFPRSVFFAHTLFIVTEAANLSELDEQLAAAKQP